MLKENILFIDATWTVLSRYPLELAINIDKKYPKYNMHFINMGTGDDDVNTSKDAKNKINNKNNHYLHNYQYFDLTKISLYIKKIQPNIIYLGGYRVFDMIICYFAKLHNIKIYSVQHGFEVDHFNRSTFAMMYKFKKILRYCYGLIKLAKANKINKYKLLVQYTMCIKLGKSLKASLLDKQSLRPDCVFVYSNYYVKFWNKKFGIPSNITKVIGSIDLYKIVKGKPYKKENAICYLAQTFVEDGRMTTKVYLNILKQYANIYKQLNKKVYIKLHPRSNELLYTMFSEVENVFLIREKFPICELYIGHYSSTVFSVKAIESYLILHELVNERIAKQFTECADYITNNPVKIKQKILQIESTEKLKPKKATDFIKSAISEINPLNVIVQQTIYNTS